MDKYSDYLKKKHFPITRVISEKEFKEKKHELPEDEFNRRYLIKGTSSYDSYEEYYEIIADNPTDQEFTIFLMDELLEQQRVTARKTSIIAGIVIFWLICSIASGIYIAVTLNNLF